MPQRFLETIIAVAAIAVLGALARRRGLLAAGMIEPLRKLVLFIGLPSLAFYTIISSLDLALLRQVFHLPVVALYFVCVGMVAGMLYLPFLRIPGRTGATFLFCTAENDSLLLPLPLIFVLYGERGLAVFFVFAAGFLAAHAAVGVWILNRTAIPEPQVQEANIPLLVTIIIAVGFGVSGTARFLPAPFLLAAQITGSLAIPLAALLAGAVLTRPTGSHLTVHLLLGIVRFALFPALAVMSIVVLAYKTGMDGDIFNIILITILMPTAASAPALCRRLNAGDADFAADAAFYTSLAAIITAPVLFRVFGR